MAGEAVTADAVVVELEAKLGNYQRDVSQGASTFDQSMKRIEGSATRAEKSVGRSMAAQSQSTRLLGYQIADIGAQLSAGTNPFLIIAQQAPQVANALDGTTGAAGKMATFFSGPWGAALLAAGSILGVVIGRLINAATRPARR
jgi:phage-related minor tail protein